MLGWHISVYRQANGGQAPATAQSPHGTRLAVWQTGLGGIDWLDELVTADKALDLGRNGGYPCLYTARGADLIPRIVDVPPLARSPWHRDGADIVTEKWEGKTVIDRAACDGCRPDEWLLVVAWDES